MHARTAHINLTVTRRRRFSDLVLFQGKSERAICIHSVGGYLVFDILWVGTFTVYSRGLEPHPSISVSLADWLGYPATGPKDRGFESRMTPCFYFCSLIVRHAPRSPRNAFVVQRMDSHGRLLATHGLSEGGLQTYYLSLIHI